MKTKLLFLFLITFFSLPLFSQDYDAILKEGAFWDIKTTVNVSYCNTSDIESIKRIQVDGDTIIQSKTYKKLKSVAIQDNNPADPCFLPPFYFNSDNFTSIENMYLRENIAEKKLYILTNYISGDALIEYTVCDFSLNIGHTLENYLGFDNTETQLIVDDIKTDENNKKVFYMNDGSYYTEGIGRNEGNLNIHFNLIDGTNESLFCNGNDENQNSCATVLSIENYNLTAIKTFPNPVKDILTIQNTENITIKIYSFNGALLKTETSKTNLEVDISSFSSGIYFLEISNLTSKQRRKFIKI